MLIDILILTLSISCLAGYIGGVQRRIEQHISSWSIADLERRALEPVWKELPAILAITFWPLVEAAPVLMLPPGEPV